MKKQVSIRLEDATIKKLDKIALAENRTRTNMLEWLILNFKNER